MRVFVMMSLLLLMVASTCRADDPLESLNTVEETLNALAQYKSVHASAQVIHHSRPEESRPPQHGEGEGAETSSPIPSAPAVPPVGREGESCCQEGARQGAPFRAELPPSLLP